MKKGRGFLFLSVCFVSGVSVELAGWLGGYVVSNHEGKVALLLLLTTLNAHVTPIPLHSYLLLLLLLPLVPLSSRLPAPFHSPSCYSSHPKSDSGRKGERGHFIINFLSLYHLIGIGPSSPHTHR